MLSAHLSKEQANCLDFTQLDLCFLSIKVINHIPATVKFISKLYLNGNYLMSLNGIQQFYNLEVFHFNYNLISLPNQLTKIHNPFFVKDLSFIANPIYYCKSITLDSLRQQGFRRLQRINVFQNVNESPKKIAGKIKKISQYQKFSSPAPQTDHTVRRVGIYKHSPQQQKTNRKFVGKIYLNPKFATDRIKQKQAQYSKQTKQSTINHNLQMNEGTMMPSSPLDEFKHSNYQQVKAFEHSNAYSNETAKFSVQNQILSEQFLTQEKQRLAGIYYNRCILQKCFKRLKEGQSRFISIEQQIQPYQGQILNNSLQTIHFSLIKLKHNFLQRT